MMEEEQNNDHVTIHQTEKQGYLNYTTSDEGLVPMLIGHFTLEIGEILEITFKKINRY